MIAFFYAFLSEILKYSFRSTPFYEESSCLVTWRIKRVSALVAIIIDRVNAPSSPDTSFSENIVPKSGSDVYPILSERESGLIGQATSSEYKLSDRLFSTTVRKESKKGSDTLCEIFERRGLVHLRPKEYRVEETEGRSASNA